MIYCPIRATREAMKNEEVIERGRVKGEGGRRARERERGRERGREGGTEIEIDLPPLSRFFRKYLFQKIYLKKYLTRTRNHKRR